MIGTIQFPIFNPETLQFVKNPKSDDYQNQSNALKLYYRTSWDRKVIRDTLRSAGLVRTKKKKASLYWTHHLPRKTLKTLSNDQRVNHFPDSWCIGRKDRLVKCMERARSRNKDSYGFVPKTFLLPRDHASLITFAKNKRKRFILKPVSSSCGKGIKLLTNTECKKIKKSRKCVVQEYVKLPYLISNKKFDLRLYCLVTSFDPLRIYIYRNGIVRFASKSYSTKKKTSKYSYLTNFSVNKKIVPITNDDPCIDSLKWTLDRFWNYLAEHEGRESVEVCKGSIRDIVIKTLIAADAEITPTLRSSTRSRKCCFELFGFDILLDRSLKPWLLEVNISPSLMVSSSDCVWHTFYL